MGHKILVFDKSLPLAHSLKFMLEEGGYEVSMANDEKETETEYNKGIYDLVIVDLKSVENRGQKFLLFLQKETEYKRIPVLALIAPEDEEITNENLPDIIQCITIPFSNEKLMLYVNRICS